MAAAAADALKQCESAMKLARETDRRIQRVLKVLSPVAIEGGFSCLPCSARGGYFEHNKTAAFYDATQRRVVLCWDRLDVSDERAMADVVLHELLHAIDYCRIASLTLSPEERACSEVRAHAMATCSTERDGRARAKCAREGAVRSCQDALAADGISPAQIERIVDRVFQACYDDRAPFREHA